AQLELHTFPTRRSSDLGGKAAQQITIQGYRFGDTETGVNIAMNGSQCLKEPGSFQVQASGGDSRNSLVILLLVFSVQCLPPDFLDRKSTRLTSSHATTS